MKRKLRFLLFFSAAPALRCPRTRVLLWRLRGSAPPSSDAAARLKSPGTSRALARLHSFVFRDGWYVRRAYGRYCRPPMYYVNLQWGGWGGNCQEVVAAL